MHTIRLRGPWQLEPLARFIVATDGTTVAEPESLPPATRATMPGDWSESFGADFLGRVRYVRTFNRPTGLENGERVWLVVEPPRSLGTVHFSGRDFGDVQFGGPAGRFDITELLSMYNRLEIVVEHSAVNADGVGGLVGEVRLEIETG